jgi:hypothetical protein
MRVLLRGYFVAYQIIKVSARSGDEEKISTAEHAETAEFKQKKEMEKWNNGIMEWWVIQLISQYSNIPSFQFSNLSLCGLCDLCG